MQKEELNRKNRGITLIALIITIIVMLILVGVSVTVSLNGGLFETVKTAAIETEEQLIYDQIVMGMQIDNSKINVTETFAEAQETLSEYTVTEKLSGNNYIVLTVEGKNGIYTYTITNKKIVIGEEIPQIGQVNNQLGNALQVGDFIKYNNETWVVLYNDEANGLQIVPTEWKSSVTLSGIDGFANFKSKLNAECENHIYTSEGAVDARCLGPYNFENKDFSEEEICYLEKADGSRQEIKNIQPSQDQSEVINIQIVLTSMGANNLQLTKSIWFCNASRYVGTDNDGNVNSGGNYVNPSFGVIYFDHNTMRDTHQELVGYNLETKEITEKTATYAVVPVVQIDKRIVISDDENDGSTPDKAYTYTFNK